MRKQEIFPKTIIEKTISLVAKNGLESLSTRKVAQAVGIAEGSIFNYFPTKKDLLFECLYYIDRELDSALRQVKFQGFQVMKNVRALWRGYFDFLLVHGDYAKYYRQFCNSHYYTEEVRRGQGKSFAFLTTFLLKNRSIYKIDPAIFWAFLTETTITFAIQIVDGRLPSSQEDIDTMFYILIHGVGGVLDKHAKVESPDDDEVEEAIKKAHELKW